MFGLGAMEMVVILVLALIIFGPGKLPEVGKAVGKAFNEFKRAASGLDEPTKSAEAKPTGAQATHQLSDAKKPASGAEESVDRSQASSQG